MGAVLCLLFAGGVLAVILAMVRANARRDVPGAGAASPGCSDNDGGVSMCSSGGGATGDNGGDGACDAGLGDSGSFDCGSSDSGSGSD